jgi:hypothetical protein
VKLKHSSRNLRKRLVISKAFFSNLSLKERLRQHLPAIPAPPGLRQAEESALSCSRIDEFETKGIIRLDKFEREMLGLGA